MTRLAIHYMSTLARPHAEIAAAVVLGTTFTNTPKPEADPPKGRLPS